MTVEVDIKALLESGAHFGHKTSRWHPKMAPLHPYASVKVGILLILKNRRSSRKGSPGSY